MRDGSRRGRRPRKEKEACARGLQNGSVCQTWKQGTSIIVPSRMIFFFRSFDNHGGSQLRGTAKQTTDIRGCLPSYLPTVSYVPARLGPTNRLGLHAWFGISGISADRGCERKNSNHRSCDFRLSPARCASWNGLSLTVLLAPLSTRLSSVRSVYCGSMQR